MASDAPRRRDAGPEGISHAADSAAEAPAAAGVHVAVEGRRRRQAEGQQPFGGDSTRGDSSVTAYVTGGAPETSPTLLTIPKALPLHWQNEWPRRRPKVAIRAIWLNWWTILAGAGNRKPRRNKRRSIGPRRHDRDGGNGLSPNRPPTPRAAVYLHSGGDRGPGCRVMRSPSPAGAKTATTFQPCTTAPGGAGWLTE